MKKHIITLTVMTTMLAMVGCQSPVASAKNHSTRQFANLGKAKQHVSCTENVKLKICEGHKQVVVLDSLFQLSLTDPKPLVDYEGGFALPLDAPVLFTMLNYQGPVSQAQLDANVFPENKGLSLDIPFLLTLKDTERQLSINTVGTAAWCEAQFWAVIDKE